MLSTVAGTVANRGAAIAAKAGAIGTEVLQPFTGKLPSGKSLRNIDGKSFVVSNVESGFAEGGLAEGQLPQE